MTQLNDGHSTRISFLASSSGVSVFFEKEVQPPGLEGGGAIDVTLMSNTTYRTRMPKQLLTTTDNTLEVAYDPATYDEMIAMINVNQLITITFPDASTLAFWGEIDSFVPNNHVEGEQPTAAITIVPSNVNDSDEETAPDYTAAP